MDAVITPAVLRRCRALLVAGVFFDAREHAERDELVALLDKALPAVAPASPADRAPQAKACPALRSQRGGDAPLRCISTAGHETPHYDADADRFWEDEAAQTAGEGREPPVTAERMAVPSPAPIAGEGPPSAAPDLSPPAPPSPASDRQPASSSADGADGPSAVLAGCAGADLSSNRSVRGRRLARAWGVLRAVGSAVEECLA